MTKKINVSYKYLDIVEKEMDLDDVKNFISEIYEKKPSDFTIFFENNEYYINFIFDNMCEKWNASTYIELKQWYLRLERDKNDIIEIIMENLFN